MAGLTDLDNAKMYVRRALASAPPFSQGTRDANGHASVLLDEVLRLELEVQSLKMQLASRDQEHLIIAENYYGHIHVLDIGALVINQSHLDAAKKLGSPMRVLSIPITEHKVP